MVEEAGEGYFRDRSDEYIVCNLLIIRVSQQAYWGLCWLVEFFPFYAASSLSFRCSSSYPRLKLQQPLPLLSVIQQLHKSNDLPTHLTRLVNSGFDHASSLPTILQRHGCKPFHSIHIHLHPLHILLHESRRSIDITVTGITTLSRRCAPFLSFGSNDIPIISTNIFMSAFISVSWPGTSVENVRFAVLFPLPDAAAAAAA